MLSKWAILLNNNNLSELVNLYTNESSLISTFEGIFDNDIVGIQNYFTKLLKKNTKVIIISHYTKQLPNNTLLEYGIYQFGTIQARYSMLSTETHILHHHSSLFA